MPVDPEQITRRSRARLRGCSSPTVARGDEGPFSAEWYVREGGVVSRSSLRSVRSRHVIRLPSPPRDPLAAPRLVSRRECECEGRGAHLVLDDEPPRRAVAVGAERGCGNARRERRAHGRWAPVRPEEELAARDDGRRSARAGRRVALEPPRAFGREVALEPKGPASARDCDLQL